MTKDIRSYIFSIIGEHSIQWEEKSEILACKIPDLKCLLVIWNWSLGRSECEISMYYLISHILDMRAVDVLWASPEKAMTNRKTGNVGKGRVNFQPTKTRRHWNASASQLLRDKTLKPSGIQAVKTNHAHGEIQPSVLHIPSQELRWDPSQSPRIITLIYRLRTECPNTLWSFNYFVQFC